MGVSDRGWAFMDGRASPGNRVFSHCTADAAMVLLSAVSDVPGRDAGNRGTFEDADAPLLLHPDFTREPRRCTGRPRGGWKWS